MILNAPSFFNSVFALVKPMLNEATKKKIDLLPVANVGEEMLKVIPADHLPLHYGGKGRVRMLCWQRHFHLPLVMYSGVCRC